MAFESTFQQYMSDLIPFLNVDGGTQKARAFDQLFDFLVRNKDEVASRLEFSHALQIRLLQLTQTDYRSRAYHYLHSIFGIPFHSYYNDDTDQCVEYFDLHDERHYVIT